MMATAVQTAARTTFDGCLQTACHPDWAYVDGSLALPARLRVTPYGRGQRVRVSQRFDETA